MNLLILILLLPVHGFSWGFFAHQRINRLAIFTLPPEMIGFFKYHVQYITENAVAPDRRRYAVDGEAPRHYIDLDVYGDSVLYLMPRTWEAAVEKFSEDTLMAYGIVPWHINFMKFRLTEAFRKKDWKNIIKLSTEIGHYIADAHVPLHTTLNYNGQLTNQIGIHGFWESRLPELFSDDYDFFVGQANYIQHPQSKAWEIVSSSHAALDTVLTFEKELSHRFSADKKYSFEERNNIITRVYSKEFSQAYHNLLAGQVERRMRASVKAIGDFWYTCWVDAGQPELQPILNPEEKPEDLLEEIKNLPQQSGKGIRDHESGVD
ncbi:hypothetical protein BH23BAC1_BH23BAC1_16950 [soil metagenome]